MCKRAPQFEDCLRLERFTGGDYCAQKHLLCYASTKSEGIILKDLRNGTQTRITAGGSREGNPVFSPDGSSILFLSAAPGRGRQIYRYDCVQKECRCLTDIRGSVTEPLWSPDGKWILFASNVGQQMPKKEHPDEAVVIEALNYKFDGRGYIPPDGWQQLYLVPATGGAAVQITDGSCDYLHHNWSPDGKSIVCVSNCFRREQAALGYDLVLIGNVTEQPRMRRLSEDQWVVSYPNPVRPVFTVDGKSVIAGVLDFDPEKEMADGYPEVYLWRFDVKTGQGRRIFEPDENCYQCVQFPYNAGCGWGMEKLQVSDDGSYVYFLSGWNGQCCLYRLPLAAEAPAHAEKVLCGKVAYHGIGRIQDGKMLLARSEPDLPEAYYIFDSGSLEEPLYKAAQSAQDLLLEVEFASPEDFSVRTSDGESCIHGWVLGPAEKKEKTYPAFLYVHGGPHPFYTYGFTMEHQCFAAAGFGLMYCNPRGSSGYGRIHQRYERAMDGSAYYDCLQFVEEAVRRNPWIDGSHLGVTGGSYGGYMTNYMAVHSGRFCAYISQRCVASELISYGSSDMHGESRQFEKFEEFMLDALEKSTVSYAEKIDRPFLILHGEEDYRTPAEGAHQLFAAIKDTHPGLPVKMVVFPHTNHDQPLHPKQLMLYYQEMVDWFRKYL